MKRLALAAALCLSSSLVLAQQKAPETPKSSCEKPDVPGRLAMEREKSRATFQHKLKAYETCMKAFVEERKAVINANHAAVNAAIDEYNGVIAEVNAAQGTN